MARRAPLSRFAALALFAAAFACGSPAAPGSSCAGTAGAVCYGSHNYLEYDAGDLPVVVTVPHGGALEPAAIPDRTIGTTVTDSNTIDLGRAVAAAFQARTGRPVHLVICHLKRTKLDANRELLEAAQGNPDAVTAWGEYHAFVDQAIATLKTRYPAGIYVDLHGHGHDKQRLELGYLLTAATLDLSDAGLDAGPYRSSSSLRLANASSSTFSAMLRGPMSFGGLLEPGFPSVPSPTMASPGADPYFDGGYSTDRYAAKLAGLQIESNFTGVRDTAVHRAAFAEALVTAVTAFAAKYLGVTF
jgi:hypothetical protein